MAKLMKALYLNLSLSFSLSLSLSFYLSIYPSIKNISYIDRGEYKYIERETKWARNYGTRRSKERDLLTSYIARLNVWHYWWDWHNNWSGPLMAYKFSCHDILHWCWLCGIIYICDSLCPHETLSGKMRHFQKNF